MPNIVEKIMSAKERSRDEAGVLLLDADYFVTPELSVPLYSRELVENGVEQPPSASRTIVIIDHQPIACTIKAAERNARVREVSARHGFTLFDTGRSGIHHQFLPEIGIVRPGSLIVAADTHATTWGAFGCLTFPVGYEITTAVAANGYWTEMPEVVSVELVGHRPTGVMSRDIAFHILRRCAEKLADRVVEFGGPAWGDLSVDERMTICNTMIEAKAITAIGPADAVVTEYLGGRVEAGVINQIRADEDATYAEKVSIDVSVVELLVALPGDPLNVAPLEIALGKPITQGYIGSCAAGRLEDFSVAAAILKGQKVAAGVRLIMVPSSPEIQTALVTTGMFLTFIEAGAVVMPPTCGPCAGSMATLGSNDVCICTAPRNDKGRMGSRDAEIYLANAAVVAASAISGKIARPQ